MVILTLRGRLVGPPETDDLHEKVELYLKKDMKEIDILCPNEYCYLRELGFLKFNVENGLIKLEKGRFYAPYVTWNATRMSEEKTVEILKQHLVEITEKHVHWEIIKKEYDHLS